jgi:hypothetical protein
MELLAHHLAATVVAVYFSKYHRIRGVIALSTSVRKQDYIFLDPERVMDPADPASQFSSTDPDVLIERAVIDLAGHEAEHIFHIVNGSPEIAARILEHEAILNSAMESVSDLSVTRSELVMKALELVSRNWFAVRDLSSHMLACDNKALNTQAALKRLDIIYGERPGETNNN